MFIGQNWAHDPQMIIVLIVFAVIIAILATFWFGSIVRDLHNSSHAKLQQKHAREKERIKVKAEREKAKLTSQSYQKIEKATKNAHSKANMKVGAAFAAALGAGAIMVFSQLITVGMMVLIASGSGLAGYLARAKQERQSNNQLPAPGVRSKEIKRMRRKKLTSTSNRLKAQQ